MYLALCHQAQALANCQRDHVPQKLYKMRTDLAADSASKQSSRSTVELVYCPGKGQKIE